MKRWRKRDANTDIRVLCAVCSEWFELPRQCLELSNWNVCPRCLDQESQETLRILVSRGITCMGLPRDALPPDGR
jgi:hypothetical protein